MSPAPLRRILLLQPLLAVIIPVAMAAIVGFFWLRPQITHEIEQRQLLLARVVSSRVNGYLETSVGLIQATWPLAGDTRLPLSRYQQLLDDQVQLADPFSAIYLVDYQGQVRAVGLHDHDRFRRPDLLNSNLANNPIFKGLTPASPPRWSETFLSLVTNGLSTAHVSPTPQGVLIAEVDLDKMNRFLREISPGDGALIHIIDQRGQVIADEDGRHTAMQLNVSSLPLVAAALAGKKEATGSFVFEGRQMIGSVAVAPLKGWHVLVALSTDSAYRSQLATIKTIMAGLLLAIALGMCASYLLARRLSRQVEKLAGLARGIAGGADGTNWPTFSVAEFSQLSTTMQQMAMSLSAQGAALRQSEKRLSLAISATADAVWEWTYPTGDTYFSPRWYAMLGYDDRQLPMTIATWESLVHPDDLHRTRNLIQQTIDDGLETGYAAEFRMRHAGGTWLWVLARGNVVELDTDGQPLLISGTITDITERRRLEEQLHQSQKMDSIGRLAGGVAHDFNNMLTVIMGAAEIALWKVADDEYLAKLLKQISKAAERSSQITRQLLTYSRKQVIDPKPANLNALITDAQQMLTRLISENIHFYFRPAPDLWSVMIDPSQLDQVLMNLCINARDAMPNGGSLHLETANTRIEEPYAMLHVDSRPGDYVQLTVSDTGTGMDQETQQHIFEPFFTTKGVGKGTGLGLATVYGIVTQNGGFISVYSEAGSGSSFKIFFPRHQETLTGEDKVVPDLVAGQESILLVEDEEMLLTTTTTLLERLGYTVIQASSPNQGIAICADTAMEIDLILTDVVMPEMNGREMVERIRGSRPGIRVLFMSGYSGDIVANHGIIEEGMHYIEKPLNIQQLSAKIRQVLAA